MIFWEMKSFQMAGVKKWFQPYLKSNHFSENSRCNATVSIDEDNEEWCVDLEDLAVEDIHNLKSMEDSDTLQDNWE